MLRTHFISMENLLKFVNKEEFLQTEIINTELQKEETLSVKVCMFLAVQILRGIFWYF